MRSAITRRKRVVASVLPLSGLGAAAAAGALGAAGFAAGVATGVGAAGTKLSMSSFLMRPPTPDPLTWERSIPFSRASCRTSGVV